MAGIVGILGVIPFCGGLGSANTFSEISKTNRNVFVKHRILNGNDLLEDVGVEPIDLDIQMKWVAGYTLDPSVSLAALEGLMAAKIPVPIIVGGVPLGRAGSLLTLFIVEGISSKMTKWKGRLLVELTANVKLCEFGNPLSIAGPLGSLLSAGASAISSGLGSALGGGAGNIASTGTASPAQISAAQAAGDRFVATH